MSTRSRLVLSAAIGLALVLSGCGSRSGAPPPAPAPESPAAAAAGSASVSTPAPAPPGAAPSDRPAAEAHAPERPGAAAAEEAGASAPGKAPARRVGQIVYLEGGVTLHRGGLEPQAVDIGQVVENYDVVQTGPASRATLELAPGSPGGAEIRIAENTVFYYDSALQDSGARKTVLQLLAGSAAFKVEKLASGEFSVAADGAALGVRGTFFIVNTIPDGALLVTCSEGRVEVSDDTGERLHAQPGRAVSQAPGQSVQEELVSLENLADYRVNWVDESLKSLEARAPKVIAGHAKRYSAGRADFDAAYARLREHALVLEAWEVAREAGGEPRFTDWIAEKKAVAPALFDCLAALFKLERPFYRLQEFSRLHDRGVGAGVLPDGRPTADFFEAFWAESPGMEERLAWVRRALLLFKYASAGSPLGQFFGAKAETLGGGAPFLED